MAKTLRNELVEYLNYKADKPLSSFDIALNVKGLTVTSASGAVNKLVKQDIVARFGTRGNYTYALRPGGYVKYQRIKRRPAGTKTKKIPVKTLVKHNNFSTFASEAKQMGEDILATIQLMQEELIVKDETIKDLTAELTKVKDTIRKFVL